MVRPATTEAKAAAPRANETAFIILAKARVKVKVEGRKTECEYRRDAKALYLVNVATIFSHGSSEALNEVGGNSTRLLQRPIGRAPPARNNFS